MTGVCRGVRFKAAVSLTISATPFSPTVSATPEFKVPQTMNNLPLSICLLFSFKIRIFHNLQKCSSIEKRSINFLILTSRKLILKKKITINYIVHLETAFTQTYYKGGWVTMSEFGA